MSIAPVAAAISGKASGAMKSKTQLIASPGPAMKPSSDIDLFTTTLPEPVFVGVKTETQMESASTAFGMPSGS